MQLAPGDPVPMFRALTRDNPSYALDAAAGRYLLLALVADGDDAFIAAVEALIANPSRLPTVETLALFGLLRDRQRWAARTDHVPFARWMLDDNGAATAAFGLGGWSGWVLIDPSYRVLLTLAAGETARLPEILLQLPPPLLHAGVELPAPVLVLPRVFEPEFCRTLIAAYEADGGAPSGFMREVDGKTLEIRDPSHKIRRDLVLSAGPLRDAVRSRIQRRLAPQIARAFQFLPTRIERDLIACYDAADHGFFRAHRDNTTKGTAHRRFAVTINLNAEAYSGGDLRFPEFGPRTYRAPTGGAVVFSCGLLHEALPVTEGKRYAFLPFLYDEAAALVREKNAEHVAIEGYRYVAKPPAEEAT
ncbi:2OG-Fe(II) oxygenase [Caulobacter segnis]|uniref:Peroxiredoxin n=1 Tax=Caulobacter segnis TaxID=88688 RepID=A0A2W5V596_9CAUL|nr:2OG-Fe(II) oxygenase [Caulobacter segnis]PZR35189.1 MAG: peroxiredoxin [Caulobacter segnis]